MAKRIPKKYTNLIHFNILNRIVRQFYVNSQKRTFSIKHKIKFFSVKLSTSTSMKIQPVAEYIFGFRIIITALYPDKGHYKEKLYKTHLYEFSEDKNEFSSSRRLI